jgi:hypothetical protein
MTIPVINVSPNLPLPSDSYSKSYFDALTKILRLYFTSNDNINQTGMAQVSTNQALIWLGL